MRVLALAGTCEPPGSVSRHTGLCGRLAGVVRTGRTRGALCAMAETPKRTLLFLMLGKSRSDPDTLVEATEWRIRLECKMGGMVQEIQSESGKRTDLTSFDDQTRLQQAIEEGHLKRDSAHRYVPTNLFPLLGRGPTGLLAGRSEFTPEELR